MLDPGRYLAEAIYFIQYTLANILWAINRALLSIAILAESIDRWLGDNIGYFVELLANGLSAPLGGMLLFALTALGFWYLLNNVVATERWVDPSRLLTYGGMALFFFSSPLLVIDLMEEIRAVLGAGVDSALLTGAAGDIFAAELDGTDVGLPAAIPDVNSDAAIGSFDLVSAFMLVANLDELDSDEFPTAFEVAYFPQGDPSSIDLSDEADRERAQALASDGIERLFFALFAIPTAIAEHLLRLALTSVALLLYAGVPFAMLFTFFVATQAFLGAYLRQFIQLLVETFMSILIVAVMLTLLTAAGRQGFGLYIGASLLTLLVLVWRIVSALKLASAALDLFGGGVITGGAGGMALPRMGQQAVRGTLSVAGAALTGGATLAVGGAALASAAALQADQRNEGRLFNTDPDRAAGRIQQLRTVAGYALGHSDSTRRVIERSHELRTLSRNLRDGQTQNHDPDMLDYLRAGSSMSGHSTSPWLAMRLSPSLRSAYDQIGGAPGYSGHPHGILHEGEGPSVIPSTGQDRLPVQRVNPSVSGSTQLQTQYASLETALNALTQTLAQTQGGGIASSVVTPTSAAVASATTAPQSSSSDSPAQSTTTATSSRQPTATASDRQPTAMAASSRQPTLPIPDLPPMTPAATPQPAVPAAEANIQIGNSNYDRYLQLDQLFGQLEAGEADEGAAAAAEDAHDTLTSVVGPSNASRIREAVRTHGAQEVSSLHVSTWDIVDRYRANGMSDADILHAFHSGEAGQAITEQAQVSLPPEQLAAITDLSLLPRRSVSRVELVQHIGRAAQEPATAADSHTLAQSLGSPIGFGSQTGTVRGVLAGARRLQLDSDTLAQLAVQLQQGERAAAQQQLVNAGHPAPVADMLLSDLSALPDTIHMPQTTAVQVGQMDETSGEAAVSDSTDLGADYSTGGDDTDVA